MKKVPYHNPTNKTVHIGSVSVFPNQTRMVDEALLPKNNDSESGDSPAPKFNTIAELMDQNVDVIKKEVPHLGDDGLTQALDAELEGKNRKSVLDFVGNLIADREDAQKAAEFAESLKEKTDEELQGLLLDLADEPKALAAIQEELSQRKSDDSQQGND